MLCHLPVLVLMSDSWLGASWPVKGEVPSLNVNDQSFSVLMFLIQLKAANGINAVLTAGGQSGVRHLETLLSRLH